ncbi:MAG: hypothetical protein R3247_16640, partial [Rhodothermales bacterium]|nr:hypothetical protein [Rhodothermales bacterium]
MAASSLRSDRTGLPPYVSPMLETLGRMQSRAPMRPEQLTERATALLAERFGAAPTPTEAAFAHGAPGLLAGHTNYFNGFAVLMALPQGAAVAVRAAPAARLVFDGDDAVWTFDAAAPPAPGRPTWVALVEAAVRQLGEGAAVEVAVVCTVPAGCLDAYLAALAVAVARALQALWALPDAPEALLTTLHRAAAEALGAPFSLAYLIGSDAGRPGRFTLVDTETGEHLPLDAPPPEEVGWALVDAGNGYRLDPAQDYQRSAQAHKALEG